MYNSVFTLAFSVDHKNRDASDLTATDIRAAVMQRMADLDFLNDELLEAVWPPEDTYDKDKG
jgi:hypothetical protein